MLKQDDQIAKQCSSAASNPASGAGVYDPTCVMRDWMRPRTGCRTNIAFLLSWIAKNAYEYTILFWTLRRAERSVRFQLHICKTNDLCARILSRARSFIFAGRQAFILTPKQLDCRRVRIQEQIDEAEGWVAPHNSFYTRGMLPIQTHNKIACSYCKTLAPVYLKRRSTHRNPDTNPGRGILPCTQPQG